MLNDGKILVSGGSNREFTVLKYASNGSLDTTFGNGGVAITPLPEGPYGRAAGMCIQSNGGILLAGSTLGANNKFVLMRYTPNGSLDTTFGVGGFVFTDVSLSDYGEAIAVQSDGKIVIAGSVGINGQKDFVVLRYGSNGVLDPTFGNSGIVIVNIGLYDWLWSVKIQPDGKILAGGVAGVANDDFTIIRLNQNGGLDNTFGTNNNGITSQNIGLYDWISTLELQSDGKILVGGSTGTDTNYNFAVLRFNSNGTIDNSFGTNGVFVKDISLDENVQDLVVQPDGKIIACGYSGVSTTTGFVVFKLSSSGIIDSTFGNEGVFSSSIYLHNNLASVALQSDGRIVATGSIDTDTFSDIVVLRLENEATIAINTPKFDFDGDSKTDISIFRPSLGQWWYLRSSDNSNRAFSFGTSTDKIVPGDYTGDGKTDIAIFRPTTGQWFILRSEDSLFYAFPFGLNGDIPVPADFDGDGKTDAAVFRPSSNTWYISNSSGGTTFQTFGTSGDKPVVADYDGDGKADIAIYRVSLGQWWYLRSSDGTNRAFTFGTSTDKPVQGDYTGDGKADIAIWRPSTGQWFILRSEDSLFYAFPFGLNGDIPVPGDYDGDGRFDAAVFRPTNATWYIPVRNWIAKM